MTCPHGPNSVSRFMSEQTTHSSMASRSVRSARAAAPAATVDVDADAEAGADAEATAAAAAAAMQAPSCDERESP